MRSTVPSRTTSLCLIHTPVLAAFSSYGRAALASPATQLIVIINYPNAPEVGEGPSPFSSVENGGRSGLPPPWKRVGLTAAVHPAIANFFHFMVPEPEEGCPHSAVTESSKSLSSFDE